MLGNGGVGEEAKKHGLVTRPVHQFNPQVYFATCFDPNILADFQSKEGKLLQLKPTSADVAYSEVEGDLKTSTSSNLGEGSFLSLKLVKKQFVGKYAISSDEFTNELVSIARSELSQEISAILKGVPSFVRIPTSVALPFGVFEQVLSDGSNQEVAGKLKSLKEKLGEGDVVKGLGETLVGAYPGRALSFVCKKNDLNSINVSDLASILVSLVIYLHDECFRTRKASRNQL